MDNTIIGYDTTFELNEFNQPRIRSEIETVKNTILFILFAKPGSYPSIPYLGMDIQNTLYSFYDELDTSKMEDDLIQQCEALQVFFNKGDIGIKKIKYKGKIPSLLIHIEGEETYPEGYMKNPINNINRYLIGLTYNELNEMLVNINSEI